MKQEPIFGYAKKEVLFVAPERQIIEFIARQEGFDVRCEAKVGYNTG